MREQIYVANLCKTHFEQIACWSMFRISEFQHTLKKEFTMPTVLFDSVSGLTRDLQNICMKFSYQNIPEHVRKYYDILA